MLFVLALTFLMIGVIGLCAALFILLARYIDPALLALLMGSFFCVVAGILLLAARTRSKAVSPTVPTPEIDFDMARREAMAYLDRASPTTIWLPVVLVAIVGYVVTSRRR